MPDPSWRRGADEKVYVLQEGIYDDISVVEEPMFATVDTGYLKFEGGTFPCVIAATESGNVRPWCEANGIKLTPHEFVTGQVDHIIELDTAKKRQEFERKWLG